MHYPKVITGALLLVALAIAPAYARHHGWGGPENMPSARIERLKEVLELTQQQETDIKAIVAESRQETTTLREEVRANREEIRQLFETDRLDEARLRQLVQKGAELKTRQLLARHATRTKVNQLLTPEQREKHDVLRAERMARHDARACDGPRGVRGGQ